MELLDGYAGMLTLGTLGLVKDNYYDWGWDQSRHYHTSHRVKATILMGGYPMYPVSYYSTSYMCHHRGLYLMATLGVHPIQAEQ